MLMDQRCFKIAVKVNENKRFIDRMKEMLVYLYLLVSCLASIFDGLIGMLSLGICIPKTQLFILKKRARLQWK